MTKIEKDVAKVKADRTAHSVYLATVTSMELKSLLNIMSPRRLLILNKKVSKGVFVYEVRLKNATYIY